MKNRILIFIILIGFIGIFTSCEKDGEIITISDNVIAPQITSVPDLTLLRNNSADTLEFVATPVNPGFEASVNYFLEAAVTGTDFEETIQLFSGIEVDNIKMTIADLNSKLLSIIDEDAASSVDFRLRCELIIDAGTGYEEREYSSDVQTATATTYGLPRLDLLNSGIDQKIVSPGGDGSYAGHVKITASSPFTLYDPDTETEYGFLGGIDAGDLVVDGTGFTTADEGWNYLSANINDLTYTNERYSIGFIGSATPGGWDVDTDMEYIPEEGYWFLTVELVEGACKFRRNDGWDWNCGYDPDNADPGLIGDASYQGFGNDIPVTEAGTYDVYLTITDALGEFEENDIIGTYEIIKR